MSVSEGDGDEVGDYFFVPCARCIGRGGRKNNRDPWSWMRRFGFVGDASDRIGRDAMPSVFRSLCGVCVRAEMIPDEIELIPHS
jgi:hypothetical protein